MKTFGSAIAIQTHGPDRVEDFEATLIEARTRVSRSIVETMKALSYLGYKVDPESIETAEEQREDTYVITFTMKGQQTVPLWRRLWKAVRA